MLRRPDQPTRILAIIGPTAVGKTGVSLDLAERLATRKGRPVEIVSADSRQVYRELTIGTAKPTPAELDRAPHHFIDEKSVTEVFSAGRFAEEAETRIADIFAREAIPVIVGGSTLYIEALVHGIADIPPTTEATRTLLTERLRREGAGILFEELRKRDPETARTMDATKTQRIVRALEVLTDTGTPLSRWHQHPTTPRFAYDVVVLDRPREQLYERIERRVDHMLAAGLLDEMRGLIERGVSPTLSAMHTIGYREPVAYLRGEIDAEEMVRLLKRNTRRYAKRQRTWFRRRDSYAWLDLDTQAHGEVVEMLADRVMSSPTG
ncbi:MAG: tRNA (adenosine(37)-N6)-dimethylallyltransferase MiaA [Bacteroidota bacterium]